MEEDTGRLRPHEGPEERSTRVDPKVIIPRWIYSESEEGSELDYYANQWAKES